MSKTWTMFFGESAHFGVADHIWSVLRALEVRNPEPISYIATLRPFLPHMNLVSAHYQCLLCIQWPVTYLLMISVDHHWRFRAVVRHLYSIFNFRFLLMQRSYYAKRVYACECFPLSFIARPSHNLIFTSEWKNDLYDPHRKLSRVVDLLKHLWLWFRRWC